MRALIQKCTILWSMLDAIADSVSPGEGAAPSPGHSGRDLA